jgi:hypothetical protein
MIIKTLIIIAILTIILLCTIEKFAEDFPYDEKND